MGTEDVNTRPGEAALLRELNQLRTDLNTRHDETVERLEKRQNEIDARLESIRDENIERLDAILEQTTATNGRVNALETEREARQAVENDRSSRRKWWLGVLAGALVGGIVVAISTAATAIS